MFNAQSPIKGGNNVRITILACHSSHITFWCLFQDSGGGGGGGGVNLRVETGAQFTSQCKAVFCPASAKDNILDSELIFFISASTVAHCRILR